MTCYFSLIFLIIYFPLLSISVAGKHENVRVLCLISSVYLISIFFVIGFIFFSVARKRERSGGLGSELTKYLTLFFRHDIMAILFLVMNLCHKYISRTGKKETKKKIKTGFLH